MGGKKIRRFNVGLTGQGLEMMLDLLRVHNSPRAILLAGIWALRNMPIEKRAALIASCMDTSDTGDLLECPPDALARLRAEADALEAAIQSVKRDAGLPPSTPDNPL